MRLVKLKILILSIIFTTSAHAEWPSFGQAKGLFFSLGVGPKIPVGEFSAKNDLGVGLDFTFSYVDNKILPVFLYLKLGYQHYPASDNLIKSSEYASFMTNEYLILPGLRYYFKPIIEDEILLMPIAEIGASFGLFNNTHIFKDETNRDNFDETLTKVGFHIGGGFSMFLLETTLNYYFFSDNHSLSLDLRIQIPIFAKL